MTLRANNGGCGNENSGGKKNARNRRRKGTNIDDRRTVTQPGKVFRERNRSSLSEEIRERSVFRGSARLN